jgi:hypothetical protein
MAGPARNTRLPRSYTRNVVTHADLRCGAVKCLYCGRRHDAVPNCPSCGAAMRARPELLEITVWGDECEKYIEVYR